MGRLGGVIAGCMLAAAIGCDHHGNNPNDGGGGGGGGPAQLKATIGLDLSHITGFAVSGGASASRLWPQATDGGVMSMTQTLYAIDDQGNMIVTTLTSYSGDGTIDSDLGTSLDLSTTTMTDTVVPSAIFATPKDVVFVYDLALKISADDPSCAGMPGCTFVNKDCSAVIMRKTDGALFCFDTPTQNGQSFVPRDVQSDGADELFFRDAALARIDMSGTTPQSTLLVDPATVDLGVSVMTANHDADVLCNIGGGATGSPVLRVIKKNGGLQNLLGNGAHIQWLEPGGHDFFYVDDTPNMSNVYRATRQSDGSYTTAQVAQLGLTLPTGFAFQDATSGQAYGWRESTTISENGIEQLVGPTPGKLYPISGFTKVVAAAPSPTTKAVFFEGTDNVGNGGIVRLDYPSFTQTTILTPGDFSVSAISVSATGDLSFSALRNSDGAHVLGNVPAGSSTYAILSATAPMVTTLTRIN